MNDQTVKADAGKPRLTLVPMQFVWDAAEVREFGTAKYGPPENWTKVEIQRYREALLRHVLSYIDDPDARDNESGLYALSHVACNVAFLCDLEHKRRAGMEAVPVAVTPDLVQDPIEPEIQKTEPEPEPKKRKPVDRGRIKALRAAGWEMKDIAEDVGCAYGTVWKVLHDEE